jgi:small multidrug resistance pump
MHEAPRHAGLFSSPPDGADGRERRESVPCAGRRRAPTIARTGGGRDDGDRDRLALKTVAHVKTWMLLLVAIVCETVATSALKSSEGFTRPWPSLLVVAGYAAAFYFLSLTLRHIPVGVAYAIWSAVGIVLVTLAGWLLFGQRLDAAALLGMGLIVAGVVVINVFSESSAH